MKQRIDVIRNKEKYIGKKYKTNEGYDVTVTDYINANRITVEFDNRYVVISNLRNIEQGIISNPYHRGVHGIGYMGVGKYDSNDKSHSTWSSMMSRCNGDYAKERSPTYKYASVCQDWECFQIFADWYEENWQSHMKGWHLDKDILIKGNKHYSPETCELVPPEINSLFLRSQNSRGKYPIGVSKRGNRFRSKIRRKNILYSLGTFATIEEAFNAYKTAKESWIKEVADFWRPNISEKLYKAMYNYKIEITD